MAVQMRERPIVSGKDAIKFLERTRKNDLAIEKKNR